MDNELHRMQRQADRISNVTLHRINEQKRQGRQMSEDSILLLGLILILASERADKTLLMMLLYIFA
ncbi:MAG: hypothetical protein IKL41_05440 [Clostridia bacterium]|nr:hypothetical protein [Clostridia bacterium]MBR6635051.1 hypothetical protein [Clostridia bacterium]